MSWRSKKQETVARSTTEAEYMAMSDGAQEAVWLRRLLVELGVMKEEPVQLLVDNESAIALAHNPVLHGRSKHIDVHWHFVREAVSGGVVVVQSVKSKDQLADFLTKAVRGEGHWTNMERIGVVEGRYNDGGV